MIKTIKIKGFKCFDELTLSGLKTFNVISGKNNTGKTSILDAIFSFYGVKNPTNLLKLTHFRKGIPTAPEKGTSFWSDYFYNGNENKEFEISITDGLSQITQVYSSVSDKNHNKDINLKLNQIENPEDDSSSQEIISNGRDGASSLNIKITDKKAKGRITDLYNISIKTSSEEINANINEGHSAKGFSFKTSIMITTSKNLTKGTIINQLSLIIQKKKKSELIGYIRNIDSRVNDIAVSSVRNKREVYLDIGMPEMTEISMMGEGIARALAFISVAICVRNSIILIDEIENGIHYSAIQGLIKSLIDIAKSNNNQIFTTTHSGDVIRAISNISDSEPSYTEEMSYSRIGRHKEDGNIRVEGYDMEDVVYSLNKGWELR